VPMICGGDELSHTQKGNNNTYCQDNDLTWLDWELNEEQQAFLDFVRQAIAIWKEQPVLRRRQFFYGRSIRSSEIKDIAWLEPSGEEMTDEAWDAGFVKCLGVRLAGDLLEEVNEKGEPITGDTLLMLLNAHYENLSFTVPVTRGGTTWDLLLDTAQPESRELSIPGGEAFGLEARSLAVFRTSIPESEEREP
jgi:isoamylase